MESKPTHILFGGTFDPPHNGHRLMVELCLKAFPQTEIIITPSAQPAGAFGQHKHPIADFGDRFAMCRLAFSSVYKLDQISIDAIEASLPAPNYTWKTLDKLSEVYPESRWGILLGFDQLKSFAGWQNALELVDKYDLVAIERPGFEMLSVILPTLRASLGTLDELAPGVYSLGNEGHKLYVLAGEVSDAASREVRHSITKALDKDWLDPKVTEYIKQHKLYDESEA
ncbi:MAG: nicotinate (nicotinamide) nucleotide adenylyltransferase [Chitinophagaceae bacterium]|nr:nicotinate (nicotinamide) nucleotide adenylyltransferase [Oligoflexus sp.]